MNVDKIIEKAENKLKKKKKGVKVFTFTREHFNEEMSNNRGFGFQDLKKKPKKLIKEMFKKDMEPIFEHVGDFEIIVRTR